MAGAARTVILVALSAHDVDDVIFRVADALQVPVLIAALLALALVIVEAGAFAVESRRRRRRRFIVIEQAASEARAAATAGNRVAAEAALRRVGWSVPMAEVLGVIAYHAGLPGGEPRIAKSLADFDFNSERRIERTRLLVRAGPALGLMGTLIPLSPALTGLAAGNVARLSENLRVAFSVTVLGLLVGAIAFGLSLVRDRLYGQDLSDLEYVAAVMTA
jgi:biopolymer transport protein ExbB/TolQ